jgi:uncharacterized protein (TIGR02677 family)
MDPREQLLVDDLLMRKVDEVGYLVADNAPLYRPIVRFFHQRYASGETGWLWPGEVAAFVRANHPHHPAYADDACEAHLKQLEQWGVLVSEHDVNQARTIEEFVRAARRYQISETARMIEEMLIGLARRDGSRGSLDTTRLVRLREALLVLAATSTAPGCGSRCATLRGSSVGLRVPTSLAPAPPNRKSCEAFSQPTHV